MEAPHLVVEGIDLSDEAAGEQVHLRASRKVKGVEHAHDFAAFIVDEPPDAIVAIGGTSNRERQQDR